MHRSQRVIPLVIALLLGIGLSASVQAQNYLYWFNNVSGGAEVEVAALGVEDEYNETENPVPTSLLSGTYEPFPSTYTMNYSSSVGRGAALNIGGGVEWNGAASNNTANLNVGMGSDDQIRFVSTGGTGPISATFEVVYYINTSRAFPVFSEDADINVFADVDLKMRNGGNGGSVLWAFNADRSLFSYQGYTGQEVYDSITGSSVFTGTFTADQLVTLQLDAYISYDITVADADADVSAYVILTSITSGFAVESTSGRDYSQIPEPAGAVALAGLAGLACVVLRRPGRGYIRRA